MTSEVNVRSNPARRSQLGFWLRTPSFISFDSGGHYDRNCASILNQHFLICKHVRGRRTSCAGVCVGGGCVNVRVRVRSNVSACLRSLGAQRGATDLHLLFGQVAGGAQSDHQRRGHRAGPHAPLLAAARLDGLQTDTRPPTDVQSAHACRPPTRRHRPGARAISSKRATFEWVTNESSRAPPATQRRTEPYHTRANLTIPEQRVKSLHSLV